MGSMTYSIWEVLANPFELKFSGTFTETWLSAHLTRESRCSSDQIGSKVLDFRINFPSFTRRYKVEMDIPVAAERFLSVPLFSMGIVQILSSTSKSFLRLPVLSIWLLVSPPSPSGPHVEICLCQILPTVCCEHPNLLDAEANVPYSNL